MKRRGETLVCAIGNSARGDDGLGPALAAALETLHLPGVTVLATPQLGLDEAAALAEYEAVVFVDGAVRGPAPFAFTAVEARFPRTGLDHNSTPADLVGLAHELFGCESAAFLLAIRGYEFAEVRESLSREARANLGEALAFLSWALQDGRLEVHARVLSQQQESLAGDVLP